MTFLELVRRLQQESDGSSGSIDSVLGQRGEAKRFVDWVASSYQEIQERRDNWLFLRGDAQFNTTIGQRDYTPVQAGVTDFARWRIDTFRNWRVSSGVTSETFMTDMDYPYFRDRYMFASFRTEDGQPIAVSQSPDKKLLLGPIPDDVYTVVGEYMKVPHVMVNDTDEPVIPSRFHMLIVYRAMMHYGMFESASEVVQRGNAMYREMLHRLEMDQMPDATYGCPLA